MSDTKTGPAFFKNQDFKHHAIVELTIRYFDWMEVHAYSKQTITIRVEHLSYFMAWLVDRGIHEPVEVTRPIIERYQRFMYHYRKKDDKPLSFRSQHMRLIAVRLFFKWLAQQRYILHNPASEIVLPRYEKRLPKHVLNTKEAEAIMSQPNINEPVGIRDRAILETFYSTGIRRMELSQLQLYDIDAENGTLMVRQGKGKKDRMIPIGERALYWIDAYLNDVRFTLAGPLGRATTEGCDQANVTDDYYLFLNTAGKPIHPNKLTALVRDYVKASGTHKTGSCHLFRHTMATLLLENGADIRFIQSMLGHASIETTQIYTQVSIRQLKDIHEKFHPARMPGRAVGEAYDQARLPSRLQGTQFLLSNTTSKMQGQKALSENPKENLKPNKTESLNKQATSEDAL